MDFEREGRLWMRNALAMGEREAFLEVLGELSGAGKRIALAGRFRDLVTASAATAALRAVWPGMRPVRAVLFDKSDGTNWALPWHQDRVIAVKARAEVPGFCNWTKKAGQWHCEPPEAVLRPMLFTRFHLDAAHGAEGAMEIALGSHRRGLLTVEEAAEVARSCPGEVTDADAGDVLVLSMLTVHRSRAALRPARRRVLRVDFADFELPAPLAWNT